MNNQKLDCKDCGNYIDNRFMSPNCGGCSMNPFYINCFTSKIYKTQREIYKELFDDLIDDCDSKISNIYAVQNTVRVWREQYD